MQRYVEQLQQLTSQMIPELQQIKDEKSLQELRVKYMGKKKLSWQK